MTLLAFDTECRGLDWWDPDQGAFLASWSDGSQSGVVDLSDTDATDEFLHRLHGAMAIVCHNLSYDCHQLREATGYDLLKDGHQLHDTDILARIVMPKAWAPVGTYKLKNLAKIHVAPDAGASEAALQEIAEQMGLKLDENGAYYEIWRAYPEILEQYAQDDAVYTWHLYEKLVGLLDDRTRECYDLERGVAPILIRAEQIGIAIDQGPVTELAQEYEAQERELRETLSRELGEQALGGKGSEAALLEALTELGVPLYRKTKTGKISTAKYALQEFAADFPVLDDYMEHRQVEHFLNTYIHPMVGRDVVHTSFRQAEARTGRMSSTRPNLQNLPKRAGKKHIRKPIVPRAGYAFVVSDYSSIEPRLLAYYMADEEYKEKFRRGVDPHAWMAATIHGGEIDDYAEGTELRPLRDEAKHTFMAISYGAGAPKVADMNNTTKEEAKGLITKIKGTLPRYGKLMGRIRKKITVQGYVNDLFGRRQVVARDKAYVGLASLIQGSAASVMKQGLVNVAEAVEHLGAYPVLVVHDEIVTECPIEHAKDCLVLQNAAMLAAYDLDPPLAVEGTITTTSYADA